jgi:hypothetical protein
MDKIKKETLERSRRKGDKKLAKKVETQEPDTKRLPG